MAEFHLGDSVVTLEDFAESFVVKQITDSPHGPLYSGDGKAWYKADQLDYAVGHQEMAVYHQACTDLRNFEQAMENLRASAARVREALIPKAYKIRFQEQLAKTIE